MDQTIFYKNGSTAKVNFDAANYYNEPVNQSADQAAPAWLLADQRASFITAYNSGTFNVQNAYDVRGLNYHQALAESRDGRSQIATSQVRSKLTLANYVVAGSMDGAACLVSW